jgi:hypothetical protein
MQYHQWVAAVLFLVELVAKEEHAEDEPQHVV